MNTLEEAHKALTTALEIIKEQQEQIKKITNEKDRYKSQKDIDAHRLKIATKTIEEYEDELGVEDNMFDPYDSEEKQQRKARSARKHRCIRYLNQEHDYHLKLY